MPIPSPLVLATRNPHKVREVIRICSDWPVEWVTYEHATWPEVDEVGQTYVENAVLKATTVARAVGRPALADDSGIEADALGGLPGPRSARFAGEEADARENLELLIEALRARPDAPRTARYRCVASCAWPDGRTVWAEGVCEGRLILDPRGTGGFGYDPIFVPDGESRTMAELDDAEKDAISHRGRALRELGRLLSEA